MHMCYIVNWYSEPPNSSGSDESAQIAQTQLCPQWYFGYNVVLDNVYIRVGKKQANWLLVHVTGLAFLPNETEGPAESAKDPVARLWQRCS